MVWRLLSVERQQIQIRQNSTFCLLAWWNIVDWSPIVHVREGIVRLSEKGLLEEKYVRFWLVYFIMFPSKTLEDT